MIDHIGLKTQQFDALADFYETTLAPLGYTKRFSFEGFVGFGRDGSGGLVCINPTDTKPSGIHLAISAPDRASVDAFYADAIAAGATDNGKPGLRLDYGPNYYAAFVLDPDGNNLEAVCHE